MLQQRLREGGFAQRCKAVQLARRRWREADHHQEFKDSLRGEQESGGNWTIWWEQVLWRRRQVCAGVQCAVCSPSVRRCAVCSQPQALPTTNQPPVLSQPLPCQGLSRAQRESERVRRRRSGSVLKLHGNRSGFRRSQESKSGYINR